MACYTDEDKKNLVVRLNRIAGQINGLSKMINDDRECIDYDALKQNKNGDEIINELVEHIDKLR